MTNLADNLFNLAVDLAREEADKAPPPYLCEWCEDSGVVKFCPSRPDRCAGCETAPCPECRPASRLDLFGKGGFGA